MQFYPPPLSLPLSLLSLLSLLPLLPLELALPLEHVLELALEHCEPEPEELELPLALLASLPRPGRLRFARAASWASSCLFCLR